MRPWQTGDNLFKLSSEISEDDFLNTSHIRYKSSRWLCMCFQHSNNEHDLEIAMNLAGESVKETEATEDLRQDTALLVQRELQLCICLCTQATQLGKYNSEPMEEVCHLSDDVCTYLQD